MFELYPILILLVLMRMRSYDVDGQPIHFVAQPHRPVDSRDSSETQALVPF